ncbi:TPA: DUF4158 domain-containing protein [Klebsiella pneumoniae]|nr:DUF4158 domain-containing protein [Klebsiella pneumoniae]
MIRQHYQYREFAWPWTFRLTRLLYTRSWISNERPGLLFDLATGWLMQHRIILPGATTLTRLISDINYRRPAVLGDVLTVSSKLEQLNGKSGTLSQVVTLNPNGEVVADALITFVCIDLKTQKALPLEGELRAKLDQMNLR